MRTDDDHDKEDSLRRRFWTERLERATARLKRAKQRGELESDADTTLMVEALVSPIHFHALISSAPIDTRVLRSLVQLVGIPEISTRVKARARE